MSLVKLGDLLKVVSAQPRKCCAWLCVILCPSVPPACLLAPSHTLLEAPSSQGSCVHHTGEHCLPGLLERADTHQSGVSGAVSRGVGSTGRTHSLNA